MVKAASAWLGSAMPEVVVGEDDCGGAVSEDVLDYFSGDGLHVGSNPFADLVGEFAGLLDEPECFLARADLGGDAIQFVVKNIAQAFGENKGEE